MAPWLSTPARRFVGVALFALGYFLLAKASLVFVEPTSAVTPVWPAGGLALAVFLLAPRRWWPALAATVFAANLVAEATSRSLGPLAMVLAVCNAAEPLIAAVVLTRVAGGSPLAPAPSTRGLIGLAAAAGVATIPVAMVAAIALDVLADAGFWWSALAWWSADALGILLLTPVCLALARAEPRPRVPMNRAARWERAGLLVSAPLVAAIVFWHPIAAAPGILQRSYAVLPLLLVCGLRLRSRDAGIAVLLVAIVSALATARGLGPFAWLGENGPARIESLQVFLAVAVFCTYGVSALATTRRHAEREADRASGQFSSVLGGATDFCVIATDLQGIITVFNVGAERMLGHDAAEMIGKRTPLAIHDAEEVAEQGRRLGLAPGIEALIGMVHDEAASARDWTFVRRDGTRLTVSLTLSTMRDSRGEPCGYMGIAQDITAQRHAEAKLLGSEERHRTLVRNLPEAMLGLYDRDLRCVLAEGSQLAVLELDPQEFVGRTLAENFPPESVTILTDACRRALAGESTTLELRLDADLTYHTDCVPFGHDDDGQVDCAYLIMRDVSDARRATDRLKAAEEQFRGAFENAPIGVAILGLDGLIQQVNAALCDLTGYARRELLATNLLEITHPDDIDRASGTVRDAVQARRPTVSGDLRLLHHDAGAIEVSAHLSIVRSPDGTPLHLLAQLLDVTERNHFEDRLAHMAHHDPLTGVYNRRRFAEILELHVEQVNRYGAAGAVLVLDVDHFKQVNDTLGHAAGDELLIEVATVLRARLRASDILARQGGDEFVVLLPTSTREQAAAVAQSIVESVRRDVSHDQRPVTMSVGITMVAPSDDLSADSLVVDADLAMYDAKEAGRDGHAFFAFERYRASRSELRMTWVQRISQAIEEDRFELVAQPILDLRSQQVTQHELLLRMVDDHGDHIPPATFLYVAERYGLIGDIDRWVAHQAIELLAAEQAAGRDTRLEVNISGRSLGDEGLLEAIESDLRRTGVRSRDLIFEITETAAIADIQQARRFAQRLSDLGCRFALDDFGAGFGSFYYLKHLPFDYLKIDGEFVVNCATNPTDRVIIESLVQIARGLGKETIAEFVEDEDTQRHLARMGVDYAQGYHIGKPIPLGEALGGTPATRPGAILLPGS